MMQFTPHGVFTAVALASFSASSPAVGLVPQQIVRVEAGKPLSRFSLLHAGVHRYLRYFVQSDGSRTPVDIWARRISFYRTPDGVRMMRITQRWDQPAKKTVLLQDSAFKAGTFLPTTHIRRLERDGQKEVKGYVFSESSVTGMRDLPGNTNSAFSMPLPEPSFNFEYDMELLQTLPLSGGKTFDIPFYDAGIDKKPDGYRFVVAGSDRIDGWNGVPVDCWLITADYHQGKVISRFWFAKRSQLLIKEEQFQPDGRLLIKSLLPPESSDAS